MASNTALEKSTSGEKWICSEWTQEQFFFISSWMWCHNVLFWLLELSAILPGFHLAIVSHLQDPLPWPSWESYLTGVGTVASQRSHSGLVWTEKSLLVFPRANIRRRSMAAREQESLEKQWPAGDRGQGAEDTQPPWGKQEAAWAQAPEHPPPPLHILKALTLGISQPSPFIPIFQAWGVHWTSTESGSAFRQFSIGSHF